jgi:hypothetical protein
VRALGRTTHAVLAGAHQKTVRNWFGKATNAFGEPRGYFYDSGESSESDVEGHENVALLLDMLMGMHESGHTLLAEHGRVMIHGPQLNAIATRCYIENILCPTASLHKAVSELWSSMMSVLADNEYTTRKPGCLAEKLGAFGTCRRPSKRPKTEPYERSLTWLANNVDKAQLVLLARAISLTSLVSTIGSDAGKRYRHLLSVNELQVQRINVVHELLFE